MPDLPETPRNTFCGRTRREFFWEAGGAFTSVALAGMLLKDGFLARQANAFDGVTPLPGTGANPLACRPPALPGKAKSVIFLFMYGGPSHVDTFDYKPELYRYDGKTIKVKTKGRGGDRSEGRVVGPKWNFRRHGQCGAWVSDLFPHLATCVDDIAFVKSMYAESPIHGSAMLMMNSGKLLGGAPAPGSGVTPSNAFACRARKPSFSSMPASATLVNAPPASQKNSRRVRPQNVLRGVSGRSGMRRSSGPAAWL
ncbi:MAG: DUF1501 domain-containing protein, partial [Planctomycetota bacterium]